MRNQDKNEKQKLANITEKQETLDKQSIHLQTLKTIIQDKEIKILLDSGSTHTLIKYDSLKNLSYKILGKTKLSIETVNGSKHCSSKIINLEIPTRNKLGVIEIQAYTVKSLTQIPENNIHNLKIWQEWKIANYNHNIKNEVLQNITTGEIDIIIGQDNLWKFVLEDTIIHPSNTFAITNTKLGWTIGGKFHKYLYAKWQRIKPKETILSSTNSIRTASPKTQDSQIEEVLTKLFNKEEEMENESEYTPDEKRAMESFFKNIKQEEDGMYTVNPLLKTEQLLLKNNYFLALQRYRGLWKSLEKDKAKQEIYTESINQMIKNGEIEEVKEHRKESQNMNRHINYLPHHGVIKMGRLTTKCRVVFDGSAKNSEGISLNSNLLPGPKRQLDIVHLLINFRLHPIALVGDISRMFYCINLNEEFRDYYRLLWNEKKDEIPKIYRFKRLTMGTVDSPFLSLSTIHYHLDKTAKEEPSLREDCELIKKHLYVDDLMAAVDSAPEAIK